MKKTTVKRKLDKLISEIVRRKGYCVKCGKVGNLQACHIFSRKNLSTRWDMENILCMCAGCHWWSHLNPILFGEFVQSYLGKLRYEALKQRAKSIRKWRIEEMESYYQTILELQKQEDIEFSMVHTQGGR